MTMSKAEMAAWYRTQGKTWLEIAQTLDFETAEEAQEAVERLNVGAHVEAEA